MNDGMYTNYCSTSKAESVAENVLDSNLFVCPRCGMVFARKSKHNYGYYCSFCATDSDKREMKEKARLVKEQMNELQAEIEKALKI